jgi:hypothetical protein
MGLTALAASAVMLGLAAIRLRPRIVEVVEAVEVAVAPATARTSES